MNQFWIKYADKYAEEGFDINTSGTHPAILNIVEDHKSKIKRVLDYGCGDGSLICQMGVDFEYSVFDISPTMLDIAMKNLESFNAVRYDRSKDIPRNKFDLVILSMVLVCVDQQSEVEHILKTIKEVKKNNGMLVLANPHPCFRDEPFSSYYTEFSIGKKFDYFLNGQKHALFIRDSDISFIDQNWTISYLVNEIIKAGMNIIKLIELKDNQTNNFFNANSSPSLILICK
jgi:2-polyprenyl-3-methyl-5-hydroxy-6-metoxy-1,4-benzoquinol methylase